MIKVGSDFSGVGAFNQALNRLGIAYDEVFACDKDKYSRQTFIDNYGEPKYFPHDVYDRDIPKESLDIYMTSPPCQSFSKSGRRLGKNDDRGILFFNSLEFIKVNNPRYFIFENVRGLLSDDGGKTFSEWINLLGGKSVNSNPILFPYEDSVDYHIYWDILNAKDYGVPQNRERVFIVGIRDDVDNTFRFPIAQRLTKKLKDILESDVPSKYYLSQTTIRNLLEYDERQKLNGNGFGTKFHSIDGVMSALKVGGSHCDDLIQTDYPNVDCKYGFDSCSNEKYGLCDTCSDGDNYELIEDTIKIKSALSKGYEQATIGDSIDYSVLNSETRRGRVGKGMAQTLDTFCKQAVVSNYKIRRLTPRECFRVMDFPDTFTWSCSDTQAYKQAGNSIVVSVLYNIIKNLNL